MERKAKPKMLAVIREAECIGCTKCIQACPVDAILGSAKQMHTVIASECIGCKLCLPPCPVDCIDMLALPTTQGTPVEPTQKNLIRTRLNARKNRLARETITKQSPLPENSLIKKKAYIQAAIARVKMKKQKAAD